MIGIGIALAALSVLLVALCTRFVRTKGWSMPNTRADGGYPAGEETTVEHAEKQAGLLRWLTTVDHKDIGILYLVFGTVAALWGGTEAMMIRTELLTPQADVWTAATYNGLFTTHGITMLFFFVTPVFFGIANYFLPLMLGADDMAFPRINAIGFWLLPPALLVSRAGLPADALGKILSVMGAYIEILEVLKPPELGWTLYTPLSLQSANPQVDLLLLGLHLSGISTTLGAINFIVTVFTERAEDMTWADVDIFSWSMLTTSGLILFAFPLLGSSLIMMLLDRNFGTTFFTLGGGGPLLWQNLFWFFGHPEVYIIFLPATGLMSTLVPKFSSRKLFGFKFIVYSTLAIGVMSFGVWAHHMFTTGIDPRVRASFMAVSLAIAVPSAVKVFNWISTMWEGRIRLTAPMIFCVGSIGTFVIGGVTGVFLAAIPVDLKLHGTYYVVGHFHFIVMGIIPFMMMAASYYWYPIITGRMYNQRLAKLQAMLMITGVPITFGTIIMEGMLGLPRRYANYPEQFAIFQQVASVGAFIIGVSVMLWLWNMVQSYRIGTRVHDADVWNLKEIGQFTREWQWFEQQLSDRYATDGDASDDSITIKDSGS